MANTNVDKQNPSLSSNTLLLESISTAGIDKAWVRFGDHTSYAGAAMNVYCRSCLDEQGITWSRLVLVILQSTVLESSSQEFWKVGEWFTSNGGLAQWQTCRYNYFYEIIPARLLVSAVDFVQCSPLVKSFRIHLIDCDSNTQHACASWRDFADCDSSSQCGTLVMKGTSGKTVNTEPNRHYLVVMEADDFYKKNSRSFWWQICLH